MDYNDLWQIRVVPSITSQATFSNDTMILSTKTLSTISERENKQDSSLPFDGNEKRKVTYKNTKRSKITSLPPIRQKLSHNYSHCSFKSDTPISTLHGNKEESHDRTRDKINKEDIHSQICKDMNNASAASFIELGAVYKILDFIRDYDFKVSLLTNNCCNKISRTLQCSLAQRRKKLEDLLSNNSSLHRCKHCGISCTLGSHRTIKKIKSHRIHSRHNDEATERDCNDQNNEKSKISINSSNLINKTQSKINDSKINHRTDNKDQLNEIELLPNKERAFIMKKYIESLNEDNNISITKASINATIKNPFYPANNIKKLFTDLEIEKKNKRCESNSAARNNSSKYESSNAIRVYANIDKEEVARKISYEPKLHSNNLLAKDQFSNITQKIEASQLLDKHGDIYPVIDNVKYLAHGQFMELDKKENELLSKLQERRYTCPDDASNERNSVLYGSREDYLQHDAGFWLFNDESKHLSQITSNEYRYLPMPRLDNNRENISFPANDSRYSHAVEKITESCPNHMDRDSLEDCALLEQTRESNATIFSSSSVENLMYGSLDRKYEINNIDDEDISRGHKLVSSKPSLDIARHFRAQIAKDRNSGNAKESIDELHTHDSNILVRLSLETRRKIYHLIKTIISSDKDQTFFHKKYLMNNVLNSEKLLHSKSADATFAPSNKIDNEIINICADDCIPIKLSDLSENENHLLKRQDNLVNICNQDLNKFKDSIQIRHEKKPTFVSANKPTKKIIRQIIYKDALLKNVRNNDEYMVAEILPNYCKILENSKNMDWENFQKFVEVLHPDEKELWHDICKIISKETERMSGDTEICIEISPVNLKKKTGEIMTCKQEIMFELDMTLKNVENFLNKRFAEERDTPNLDTPKNAEDITD